jgi:putative heme transporter
VSDDASGDVPRRPPRPAPVVPPRLTWAAAVALRLLIIALAVFIAGSLLWRLRLVVLPVFIALFASTVLAPPAAALKRRGLPPLVATVLVLASLAAVLTFVGMVIVPPFVDQFDELGEATRTAIDDLRNWLQTGPLQLTESDIDEAIESAQQQLGERQGELATGALSGAVLAAEVVVGAVVTLVLTFFFVKDGDRMVDWGLGQLQPSTSEHVRNVGRKAWRTLTGYFRGVTVEGVVEAVLIGIALVVLGVPLALPLAVITFFGGYFPLIGAVLAGLLAATVALVSVGPGTALVVVIVAILVQNLVSNLVDPLIMGRAVRIHPVVVLIAVTVGGVLGGIAGAFVAVPVTAVVLDVADYVHNARRGPTTTEQATPEPPTPDQRPDL